MVHDGYVMTQTDTQLRLSQIGQIALTVGDLDRAIQFYRDTLGMQFLFQAPNLAFFDCGGVRLMLSIAEKPGEVFTSVIYYKVNDIQKAAETLSGRGVSFEGQPHLIAKMP